jgi:hypothetical protein
MKKWLVILGVIILAIIGAVYVFIPATENFVYASSVKCPQEAATRFLINKNKWQQWWPGQKKEEHLYTYKNYEYRVNKIMLNAVDITVSDSKDSVRGLLRILGDTGAVTKLQWNSELEFSSNPIIRLSQYFQSKNIKTNIASLVEDCKLFFEKQENVYGMKIQVETVKDSSLVSYSLILDHYPLTEEIYDMIGKVKEYIKKKGGKENSSPMMHVQTISPTEFGIMVGIPTQGDLPSEGEFRAKKMVLGNILTGEVKGGVYTVTQAELEMKNFVTDFRRMSPAIPYQSLITNRMLEPDTAKWITRLYYPIF